MLDCKCTVTVLLFSSGDDVEDGPEDAPDFVADLKQAIADLREVTSSARRKERLKLAMEEIEALKKKVKDLTQQLEAAKLAPLPGAELVAEAKRYKTSWPISGAGLNLGNGTNVKVLSLGASSQRDPTQPGHNTDMTIKAVVELTAKVTVASIGALSCCSLCRKTAPNPSSYDELWFILQNHDDRRLVFPAEDGCESERDCWPVDGWKKDMGELTCGSCAALLALRRAEIKNMMRKDT
jgi:hypothetical protein